MNLAAMDLNLLVTLDALLREASVGRAAARVGLSQPAASHALRRLRDLLQDPLLVRTGAEMVLTPRAESLRVPLAETLEQIRGVLRSAEGFDPSTSSRRFTMLMPDHVVDLVLPPLVKRVAEAAPGVSLHAAPWRGVASITPELARSVDVILSCADAPLAGFVQRPLFSDTEAVAARRGRPLHKKLRRLEAFREAPQVAVVGRGQREDPVDAWLRSEGIERRVALTVSSYLQALHVVAKTDLVAVIPKRMIAAHARRLDLVSVRPPIDPGTYQEFLFYPARNEADPASIWIRGLVLEIGARLDREPI